MFLLTSTLIFISAVVYECHAEQKLECPYGSNDRRLQKVWCKRDANNESCCVGFSLSEKIEHLRVQEKDTAFTVTVKNLPQGDGVYWCGLRDLRGPNTIFKLAEKKLYNSMNFGWGILRWLLFILLLLTVVLTHTCSSRKKTKD